MEPVGNDGFLTFPDPSSGAEPVIAGFGAVLRSWATGYTVDRQASPWGLPSVYDDAKPLDNNGIQ